ncbi:hypothetical protein [Mesorhizobium sp. CAU 1741]|uniref:hypothetical protein n=1 Tax=Mesorhizobium sp. CAU 1741 TaxID=3140366 RepID=UPI00325B7848
MAKSMLREISEEVRVALKDRLRDARQVIRQHRHDGGHSPMARVGEHLKLPHPPLPVRGVESLLGHAVSAFDDAMTVAERFVPIDRAAGVGRNSARSLDIYFRGRDEGSRAFRRDLYYLAATVLAARGITGARIHETELASVHAAMKGKHGAELAALDGAHGWSERVAAGAVLCASLLTELLDHRPIRFEDGSVPNESIRTLEILCLTPIVLTAGFATVDADAAREADLLDLTILATDARIDRIEPACRGPEGQQELTRIFAMLFAHLP